jgi:AcrR family transcriptional regulator
MDSMSTKGWVMTATGTGERRGRGRRPAAEVRADALDAAARLLFEHGMAEVTHQRVAEAAGVSRTTLHKWWPSRGTLALDAYFHALEDRLAFPDTGDVEADLAGQLRSFAGVVGAGPAGRVVAELVGQMQTDPELRAAFLSRYSRPRRDLAMAALERARERGQVRADADLEMVVDQLWGACYHRLLIPDLPVTEEFATGLVGALFRGLRP